MNPSCWDISSFIVDRNNSRLARCEQVYEFEEIVGSGTFSDVVCGVHGDTSQRFAIKIIDKEKVQTEKQRWRLRNEIFLHKRSKHPNIVNFVEYFESDIDICIVMELCEGGELFNRIVEKKTFSEKETSGIIKQISSAAQYLHSLGIVHRDIKPENLVFTSPDGDEIKLADFGLAKQIEMENDGRLMLKASMSGTTAYCAPERLSQEQEGKAVDMWSIGCIMYFMLFGVPPFYSEKDDDEENEDEIFDSVLEGAVQFPEGKSISDLGKDLLLRLLEKDPNRRITADEVLIHPWIRSHSLSSTSQKLNLHHIGNRNSGEHRAALKSSINRIIDAHNCDSPNNSDSE